MQDQNFTTTLTVDQTPEKVFAAINNVRGWWAGKIEGSTEKLGYEFDYRYEPHHYSKQKITELVQNTRVAWDVLESSINFVKEKSEWKGRRSRSISPERATRPRSDFRISV